MNTQDIIQKLRRLHTLLVLGKRSNNLALAIRRALDAIATWPEDARLMVQKTPIRILFAGYGPKFIKIFEELMRTGDIAMIHQLQPEFDPFFCYLCEIPGIGETMARRMYFDCSIRSMDDLRIAYSNHILQRIPSFGDIRLKAIEDVLWISQTRDLSPADVPMPQMPSQLSLPAVFARPDLSTPNPNLQKTEYTQSYGQSYATPSGMDEAGEEEDLFESTVPPVTTPSVTGTAYKSRELFQPSGDISIQNKDISQTSDSRALPHPGQTMGTLPLEAPQTPSLPVFNAIPAATGPKSSVWAPQAAQNFEKNPGASSEDVYHAVSRTIHTHQPPEDAWVKSQLEAFIARDLQDHGILPGKDAGQSAKSNQTHGNGNRDARCMACEAQHSRAEAAYEAESRKAADEDIHAPRMACDACHSSAEMTCEANRRTDISQAKNTSQGAMICVENLLAEEIVVDELVVTLLKTDILVAESIQVDRRMPEMLEDVMPEMRTDQVSANSIYADSVTAHLVRAKRVRVRYLVAQFIRG